MPDGVLSELDVYRAGDKEKLDDNQMQRARYKLGYEVGKIDGTWYWAKSVEGLLIQKQRVFTPLHC
jgi:hypothetical protein